MVNICIYGDVNVYLYVWYFDASIKTRFYIADFGILREELLKEFLGYMINMMSYEQDPDVLRWGLHQLLDVCTLSNSGSQNVITRYDTDLSQVGYVREGYTDTEPAYVENDEVIAHVLQEEFSRIAAEEASGSVNPEKPSILEQDWVSPSGRYNNSGSGKFSCSQFDFLFS